MTVLERARERLELLQRTRSVAIVGMSTNPSRASHFVATYLLGATDWTVFFVNPRESDIFTSISYVPLMQMALRKC